MLHRVLLALVSVLFFAGCYDDAPVRFFSVDPAFTVEERAALGRCASRWDDVAPGRVVILEGVAFREKDAIVKSPAEGDDMGGWDRDLNRIRLHPNLSERGVFESVACHEMGHAVGLDHIHGAGVMNAEDVFVTDLTDLDMAECHRVGSCR